MSQFVMSQREFAGVVVSLAAAAVPLTEPDLSRRLVALGWISRRGGQVMISGSLAESSVAPTTAGR